MGRRRSKKSGQSRIKATDTLAQAFSRFDSNQLWIALFATASSPSARHRASSVGVALAAALRATVDSNVDKEEAIPGPQELIDLAASCEELANLQEDYIPIDPTNIVTVRVGDELLRYAPGLTERPIADLSRALKLAEALDERIMQRRNFGIMNAVRVAVKYVDYCISTLATSWIPSPDISLGDRIFLPDSEENATRKFLAADPLDRLCLTQSDLLALDWMTSAAATAKYDYKSYSSPFGRNLRYRVSACHGGYRWLPPTYVPEVLAHAVAELADGVKNDKRAKKALRAYFVETTRRALWRFSERLIEAPNIEKLPLNGNGVQWIAPIDEFNYIAVSLVFLGDFSQGARRSAAGLLERGLQTNGLLSKDITVNINGLGLLSLPSGSNVVPLIVFAGTSHLAMPQAKGEARMSLEDLTWIAETATDNGDLFRFVRELSSSSFPPSLGWEAINYWEVWKNNRKALLKGGIKPAFLCVEPHAGEVEWERAVALSPLENALFYTGLPPVREIVTDGVSVSNVATVSFRTGSRIYKNPFWFAPPIIAWSLALIEPPVAIIRINPDWTDREQDNFLFNTGGGLVYAFAALGESWKLAHDDLGIGGYRLQLQSVDPNEETVELDAENFLIDTPLRLAQWNFDIETFILEMGGKPKAANSLTVNALKKMLERSGVDSGTVREVGDCWLNGPPFLAAEVKVAATCLNSLPEPWDLSSSDEVMAVNSLGRMLREMGMRPGCYRGDEANALVRDYLAPAALSELNDRVALHDSKEIIVVGMQQLNQVCNYLSREQGNLIRVAQYFSTDWSPEEQMGELAEKMLKLRRCNEIVVEAAVRSQSSAGERLPITSQSWSALLAAAATYLNLTTLSERLYFRVAPKLLRITHTYEIILDEDQRDDGEFWLLEENDLQTASAAIRLSPTEGDFGVEDTSCLDSSRDSVDLAMLECFGASGQDIFEMLTALATWDNFDIGDNIAVVSENDALEWVCQRIKDVDDSRRLCLGRALHMLTLDSDIMRSIKWEPWQTRSRRHRLLAQPVVRLGDGNIIIAPQYLLMTLSVYFQQLKQGMLPWTGEIPDLVNSRLAERRNARNRRFEGELEKHLRELGFSVISRVKPSDHERLGVPELTTEIDMVCGRPGDHNIWLIEAKDPVSVYGFAEIGRQLRTFYRDSRKNKRLKPCYATQLARKESELKPYADQIARRLGVCTATEDTGFMLHAVFVTRNLTVAGFVKSKPFKVLTANEFLAAITADDE